MIVNPHEPLKPQLVEKTWTVKLPRGKSQVVSLPSHSPVDPVTVPLIAGK